MMTVVDVLRAARERIATPEQWCQGVNGLREDGSDTLFPTRHCPRVCAFGALLTVDVRDFRSAQVVLETTPGFTGGSLADFNDTHTHAEVLALFDHAIAAAEVPA